MYEDNFSLVPKPNAQQQMGLWGQMPQLQVPPPPTFDYSLVGQGAYRPPGVSVGGVGGSYSPPNSGFGMNMPTLALGLQGLNSLGSLYMGTKSLDLANKQFDSAQRFANINLRNQTQVYNDTLENKLRRIGSFNETPTAQTEAEIARRKLPTNG